MTIHLGKTETRTKRMIVKSINLPKDTDQKFHIYACHWEPKKITFYTDGIKVKTKINPINKILNCKCFKKTSITNWFEYATLLIVLDLLQAKH